MPMTWWLFFAVVFINRGESATIYHRLLQAWTKPSPSPVNRPVVKQPLQKRLVGKPRKRPAVPPEPAIDLEPEVRSGCGELQCWSRLTRAMISFAPEFRTNSRAYFKHSMPVAIFSWPNSTTSIGVTYVWRKLPLIIMWPPNKATPTR